MQRKAIFQLYRFILFLGLLASLAQGIAVVTPFNKYFVRMVNNLDNKKLDFKCQSADECCFPWG